MYESFEQKQQSVVPSERFKTFNPDDWDGYYIHIGVENQYTSTQAFKDLLTLFTKYSFFTNHISLMVPNEYCNHNLCGFEIHHTPAHKIDLPKEFIKQLIVVSDSIFLTIPSKNRWFDISAYNIREGRLEQW